MRRVLVLFVGLTLTACAAGHTSGTVTGSAGSRVGAALAASCAAYRHFTVDVAAHSQRDRLVAAASGILDPVLAYPVSMDPGVQDMFADAVAINSYVNEAPSIDLTAAQVIAVRDDCEHPRT